MARQTGATKDHKPLDALIGTWNTAGDVLGDSSTASASFQGTDTYEWLPGGYFLLDRWDIDMPDGKAHGIEIVGFDARDQTYCIFAFDNQGAATQMAASMQGGRWTMTGDVTRFSGAFGDNGNTLSGDWEKRSDERATWQPWMRVRLTRAG